MILSQKSFQTWSKNRGHHCATTFCLDNEKERDKLSETLKKDKNNFLIKNKNIRSEFWVTAFYLKKKELDSTRNLTLQLTYLAVRLPIVI